MPVKSNLKLGSTTPEILEQCRKRDKYYPKNGEEFRVSSHSRWEDPRWTFDNLTPGVRAYYSAVIWDKPMPNGRTLLAPEYAPLLEELRRFVWSCYIDPRNANALSPSSLRPFGRGLNCLTGWMTENNYCSLEELDQRASERYLESLLSMIQGRLERHELQSLDDEGSDFEADEGVHASWIAERLMPWSWLWKQRSALKDAGIELLRSGEPFGGKSVGRIARETATRLNRVIPPLPDVIACEVLNAAHRFLDVASDDLIRMSNEVFQVRKRYSAHSKEYGSALLTKHIRTTRFSIPDGCSEPWHAPLKNYKHPTKKLRSLIDELVGAVSIVIQSETGMRVSEVLSLRAGLRLDSGMPECVSTRSSRSGMLELYYLQGKTSKMHVNPENVEWLLAARPRGGDVVPSVVRAIEVAHLVLAPWREMSNDKKVREALFLNWGLSTGFPYSGEEITAMDSKSLTFRQRSFAAARVEWSRIDDEGDPVILRYKLSKGMCIVTHQWRKNYARFVFQVNPKMIPAVARQYKHLSLAMTEQAYIGTDIELIRDVANENLNLVVDLFMKRLRGGKKYEGRLARLIDKYEAELAKFVDGKSEQEGRESIRTWCMNRNLKIFFHGYGSCIPGIAPLEAECHKRAKTIHWANDRPHFANRQPSTCTGCFLFLAGPETLQYWSERYVKNMIAWESAKDQGTEAQLYVAKARAEQSANYLKFWGEELPRIEFDNCERGGNG